MKYLPLIIIALFLGGCTLSLPALTNKQSASDHISFAVIGDNEGINPTYDDLMKKIAADKSIAFVLHVGDLTAHGKTDEYAEMKSHLKSLGVTMPLYAVPGNHDITDDPNRTGFQAAFGSLPRSIDTGDIHLVLLDNADRKIGFSDSTLAWLEKDLANWQASKLASSQDSQLANSQIIIAYHRPFGYPLAATVGDDETKASRASNEKFRSILAKYDVAQIFTGHIHTNLSYDYSIAKDANGNTTKSVPVEITGGGGQPPQDLISSFLQPDYHYLKVTVVPNGKLSIEKYQDQ